MENNTMVVRTERQMTIARVDNGWIVDLGGVIVEIYSTSEELLDAVKLHFEI